MREFFAEIALFPRSNCELSVNKEEKGKKCFPAFPNWSEGKGREKKFFEKKKWTVRRQDWSAIHAQLAVFFADRMPD